MSDQASGIVDASGRPARQSAPDTCPRCGAGDDKRAASGGFGSPWTVCTVCGHEWKDRMFKGDR